MPDFTQFSWDKLSAGALLVFIVIAFSREWVMTGAAYRRDVDKLNADVVRIRKEKDDEVSRIREERDRQTEHAEKAIAIAEAFTSHRTG